MKLYYYPGVCSLAPHIILQITKIPCELIKVDIRAQPHTANGKDFTLINPKGQVPFLELDTGESLSEGAIIAQYLAELANNTELLPAHGTFARYQVLEWQNYVSTEIHKGFSPLFNPKLDAQAKQLYTDMLHKKLAWINTKLEHKTYLTGEHFTIADAYLYTTLRWAHRLNLDLNAYPQLVAYQQRIASLPAVKAAHAAEL